MSDEDFQQLTRAELLIELGRYTEAESLLRQHLGQNPESAQSMHLLASVLNSQHRFQEARDVARSAINAEPELAEHFMTLAEAHIGLEQAGPAVDAAERAVQLAPYSWVSHYNLARALRSGNRPRTRDAYFVACRARDMAPFSADAHNLVGICASDLSLNPEAISSYQEALRLQPQHAMAMNNLAALELDRGRLSKAAAGLRAAAGTAPQESIIHQNLDTLVLRYVQRLLWTLAAAAVCLAIAVFGGAPWSVRAGMGIALIAAIVWWSHRTQAALPRGMSLWSRDLIRRLAGRQRTFLVGVAACAVAVLIGAFAPRAVAGLALGVMLGSLRFLGVGLIVLYVVRALKSLVRGE